MVNHAGSKDYVSVSELTSLLKKSIESAFPRVRVGGEISNYYRSSTGHQYFTLKDAGAQIRVALFRGRGQAVSGRVEDGVFAVVTGAMAVYEKKGEYQVIASYVEVGDVGALLLKFQKLKEKLQAEGLFEEERKKELPPFPVRIGVVTSLGGAAVRDIVRVMRNRFENVTIVISPAAVQGVEAHGEIVRSLRLLDQEGNVDLIIVGRGGGSIEDLWSFNEEDVVRAIASIETPVISAVGHETDFTLTDFVADVRASTPSNAAEVAVPVKDEIRERLAYLTSRLQGRMSELLETWKGRLNFVRGEIGDPRVMLRSQKIRLADLEERLQSKAPGRRIASTRLDLKTHLYQMERKILDMVGKMTFKVSNLKGRIESLDPTAILSRGYSITFDMDSKSIISDSAEAKVGSVIETLLFRGKLTSRVEEKE